ncbi:MAG: endonuclease Q family protein [Candidatus Latescibacterota bacterium]|nr:endonuclease Q family protein [Candidatus Latescibacterota bacterium]
MEFVADIHLHSQFSRATSRDLNLENLHRWSALKGISVVGTGDFTHPEWLAEIKQKLVPAEEGLYQLDLSFRDPVEEKLPDSCRGEVRFLLTVEISCIYKKNGRTRKVHNVVCLPDFNAVDELNRRLGASGNLKSDGRPILGLDCRDLLEICLECCPEVLFIPAHVWTPHFAALGASSGFDSLEECFEDLLPHIYAIETGLSSDPPMNNRLSTLDHYALVSNSDAHSPPKLGREATLFDTELSYSSMTSALRDRDSQRFGGTLEFYPQEGKYHLDGHRKCGVRWTPAQTLNANGRCPECGRNLTVGTMHRIHLLADRPPDDPRAPHRYFECLIALDEVISSCIGVGAKSKRVQGIYFHLLEQLGPELPLLRRVDPECIARCGQSVIAEGIRRTRSGEVSIAPGYDGEYGVIEVFTAEERQRLEGNEKLFDLASAIDH